MEQTQGGVFTREQLRLQCAVAGQAGTLLENQRMTWALRVAARTRETTMEAISDGVMAVSTEGQIRSANTAAARMLGRPKAELERLGLKDLPGLGDAEALTRPEVLDGRVVRLPEGEAVVGARVVRDDFGHPAGTVLTLTAMKRVQRPVQRLISGTARYTFADLLGTSALFRAQLDLAQAAARSDAGVLITGESGTGKEVVAQSIHNASSRASGPFVGINCAAIPRDLLESELFGHEEGAFTGARRGGQPGKFEVVEGGTLLLDEIGDMPLETQAKLLRVLQERRFQRVGGNREHVLEARVLATTNRDLDELARTGRFRQDLLYRLKVIHVHLPALRERPEDIPAMVQAFLERLSARLGRHLTRVAPEVLAALVQYPWPGNVRELEHLLESEVNTAPDSATTLTRIPPSLLVARRRRDTLVGIQISSLLAASGASPSAIRPLQGAEKEVLLAALEQHGGNVLAVSKTLGVCRNKVYAMLKRFDLSLESYRKPGGTG
jgi:sigma-54 dependent transcriptional regulator, acetoin dehydrogenase operon transcriptional activator AcoR